MSINNAKAVLEAIFNQESAFIRTPKYGVGKRMPRAVLQTLYHDAASALLDPLYEAAGP